MSDPAFYVGSERDKRFTGYVPAKFLVRNGAYVMDPTPGGSQRAYLYSDGSGNNKTSGRMANPYNYLVVPANYTEQKARDFASEIAGIIGRVYPQDEMGAAGLHQALAQMIGAFWPGGSQDVQRHPQWGIPKGFVGSASNHLGFVSGLAGLPMPWSEIGGGVLNGANAVEQWGKRLLGERAEDIDVKGRYWLSKQNHANISQGYSDGVAASKPPSPFDDYGYGPSGRPDQIGDGNGIASWTAALEGTSPEQPTEPGVLSPSDRPIRYLRRWTQ
jgi:hypothetical protein